MQVLQAGRHKLLLLELDTEFIENIARQAGFEFKLADQDRCMVLDLNAEGRQAHRLGVVGHQSQTCHTQKKSAPCP